MGAGARERRRRARDGGDPQEGRPNPVKQAVEAAAKAALFRFGHKEGSRRDQQQAPEWTCRACDTPNWMTRTACRRCRGPQQQGHFSVLQRGNSPQAGNREGPAAAGAGGHSAGKGKGKGKGKGQGKDGFLTWAEKVRLFNEKATKLEQAAAAARRVGAAAAPGLAAEAQAARLESNAA